MNAPLTLGYSICLTPAAPAFVSRNASFPTARRTTLAAASMSITGRLGCGDVGAFSRDVNTPNSHFHVHGTTGQDRHAHGEVGGNCRFRGPHGHGSRSWRLSAVVMVGLNCLIGRNDSLSTSPEPRTTEASSTLAVVKWARDNVAAFGGNPHTVTVFGQSAGGGSLVSLATPSDADAVRAVPHPVVVAATP